MTKKIVIAGGTGFIGQHLAVEFSSKGYEIIIIARKKPLKDLGCKYILWEESDRIIVALENSAILINLAGKSVDCRYNEENKKAILLSRTETTKALGDAILQCKKPPELWINSSTATIYRHAEDRPMTEETGEIGSGFSVNVAQKWEEAFFSFKLPATRQVALRIAIVLGKGGGVMTPYKNLVKFGIGGIQGNGKQMFSWIHIDDLTNIIRFIQENQVLKGVYNCSAPNPVTNKNFMETLRKVMGIPFGLPAPKWLLEIGSVVIRTETELVLKSRWVIPEKLLKAGYTFKFPDIDSALKNILS